MLAYVRDNYLVAHTASSLAAAANNHRGDKTCDKASSQVLGKHCIKERFSEERRGVAICIKASNKELVRNSNRGNEGRHICEATMIVARWPRRRMLANMFSLCLPLLCSASITVMDGGSRYKSRVDNHYGKAFVRGYEYMARLQYLPDHPTLCKPAGESYTINLTHVPPDQLPGECLYCFGRWRWRIINENVCVIRISLIVFLCSMLTLPFLYRNLYSGTFGSSHRLLTWRKSANC